MIQDKEVTIDGKILSFGLISLFVAIAIIVVTLIILLYSSHLSNLDANTRIIEKDAQIYDLRRSLDKAEGRLSVYDDFLLKTRVDNTKKMAAMFMRDRTESTRPLLEDFLNYVSNLPTAYFGGM